MYNDASRSQFNTVTLWQQQRTFKMYTSNQFLMANENLYTAHRYIPQLRILLTDKLEAQPNKT